MTNNIEFLALSIYSIILAMILYFLPSIMVLKNRNREVSGGIIGLNVLLGWTFFGWLVAMKMAIDKKCK